MPEKFIASALLEAVAGGVLQTVPAGGTYRGAYQVREMDGRPELVVFAPPSAFAGATNIEQHGSIAQHFSNQAARDYFDRNPGRGIPVEVHRTDDEGNLRGRYGFYENARDDGMTPWMMRDDQARSFLQPQVRAMREQSDHADRLFEEAQTERERLTGPDADPNDEGFRYYDLQHRSDQAYENLGAMAQSYDATRNATAPATGQIVPFDFQSPVASEGPRPVESTGTRSFGSTFDSGTSDPYYSESMYGEDRPAYSQPEQNEPAYSAPMVSDPYYSESAAAAQYSGPAYSEAVQEQPVETAPPYDGGSGLEA